MVEWAIGLGLVISLLFSETLGLAAGGMVVPGYLALMIHDPLRILGTVLSAFCTLGVLNLLSRYLLIYGRRRIVIAILVGFICGAASRELFPLRFYETSIDLRTIGFVIPGLMANWMERQGVVPTLAVMATTAVLVRLLLMLLNGGDLIR